MKTLAGKGGEIKSTVFVWVFWRKITKVRVSCETFVKKSAGAPATTARAEPPVQGKTLAGKGGGPPGHPRVTARPEAPESPGEASRRRQRRRGEGRGVGGGGRRREEEEEEEGRTEDN